MSIIYTNFQSVLPPKKKNQKNLTLPKLYDHYFKGKEIMSAEETKQRWPHILSQRNKLIWLNELLINLLTNFKNKKNKYVP